MAQTRDEDGSKHSAAKGLLSRFGTVGSIGMMSGWMNT